MTSATHHKGQSIAWPPTSVARVLLLLTIAFCFLAPLIAFLSRSGTEAPEAYPIFLRLFAFNDFLASLAALIALGMALSVPKLQNLTIQLATWIGEHPALAVTGAFISLAICSQIVYQGHPLSMDEYSPWMQAHAFARGEVAAHYPPDLLDSIVPRGFQGMFIAVDSVNGHAISKYLPGLALAMTPFVWVDATWCVNPAFGALALIVIYRLVVDATSDRTAGGWAVLAALASPQFTVNAISYYAMPGELALNLAFLWLLLRSDLKSAFFAGLVGGFSLIMHNPAPHGLIAVPCVLWLAWNSARWPRLLLVLAGYVPTLAIGFAWSVLMSTMESPQSLTSAGSSVLSGLARFIASFLTIPDQYMLMARWYATWKAWIWTCPGLLLLLFIPRPLGTSQRLLIAGLVLTYLFFLFVSFDQGHGWGYRYMHGAWGALPVVAGVWFATAAEPSRKFAASMVAAGLIATPIYMWQTRNTVVDALSWRPVPHGRGDWVVFVAQNTGRYRGDLVQNPPGQENLLHLVSRGHAEDAALMKRRFPEAALVGEEDRGSIWRLPPGQLAESLSTP